MPKIIKNGKEYSGVPIEVVTAWAPTADPVQVKEPLMGNTDISNIGDGTVTGAIDELNTGLNYTYWGSQTGTAWLTLPSKWETLCVVFETPWNTNYGFEFVIPYAHVSRTPNPHRFLQGWYLSQSDYGAVSIDVTTTGVAVEIATRNGNAQASNAKIHVYYR